MADTTGIYEVTFRPSKQAAKRKDRIHATDSKAAGKLVLKKLKGTKILHVRTLKKSESEIEALRIDKKESLKNANDALKEERLKREQAEADRDKARAEADEAEEQAEDAREQGRKIEAELAKAQEGGESNEKNKGDPKS